MPGYSIGNRYTLCLKNSTEVARLLDFLQEWEKMLRLAAIEWGGLVLSEWVRWTQEIGKRRYVCRILGREEKPILPAGKALQAF